MEHTDAPSNRSLPKHVWVAIIEKVCASSDNPLHQWAIMRLICKSCNDAATEAAISLDISNRPSNNKTSSSLSYATSPPPCHTLLLDPTNLHSEAILGSPSFQSTSSTKLRKLSAHITTTTTLRHYPNLSDLELIATHDTIATLYPDILFGLHNIKRLVLTGYTGIDFHQLANHAPHVCTSIQELIIKPVCSSMQRQPHHITLPPSPSRSSSSIDNGKVFKKLKKLTIHTPFIDLQAATSAPIVYLDIGTVLSHYYHLGRMEMEMSKEGRSTVIESGSIVFSPLRESSYVGDNSMCIVVADAIEQHKDSGFERMELMYLRGELYADMPPVKRGGGGLLPPRRVRIDENELMCILIERGYKVVHRSRSVSIFEVTQFVVWNGVKRWEGAE